MKKNIRVSASFNGDSRSNGRTPFSLPLVISFFCHVVFLALVSFMPDMATQTNRSPSVINVSMVSVQQSPAPAVEKPSAEKKATVRKKIEPVKPSPPVPTKQKKTKRIEKKKPKPKTSLKKRTFKSTKVVQQTVQKMETETQDDDKQPEALKSALERLKKEVSETEANRSQKSENKTAVKGDRQSGLLGKFNENGKKIAELIDLYRIEIAFQIQKNWAFNEQLAGADKSLMAAIVFKVMPDGEIRDVFFTERSGNRYLDESAYKAIMKSNPVDSHPGGLKEPYVPMGIRFTPQGVR